MARVMALPGEPAMDRAKVLRDEAVELIARELEGAVLRADPKDYRWYAEKLLKELEPLIAEYAGPPERVKQILMAKGMLKPTNIRGKGYPVG